MSSLRGARMSGKRAFRAATIAGGVVDRQRRLGQEGEIGRIGNRESGDVLDRLDQGHRAFGNLAERADHFGVAGVADEEDVAAFRDQPLGLAVDLGDERAGRVDDRSRPRSAAAAGHRLGHAVGGKDHGPAVGHLVELVDEDRAHDRAGGRRRSGCGRSRGGHRPARRSARARARRSGSRGRRRRRSRAERRSGL